MKNYFLKTVFLVALMAMCGMTAKADDAYRETCGTTAPSSGTRPSPSTYTGWDNASIAYSSSTTDTPDLRSTSTLDSHVWFPAAKSTDLVISDIALDSYQDLTLSFDLATNASAANITNGSAKPDKLLLYFNDAAITVPSSLTFTAGNQYTTVSVSIPDALTGKVRFYYTAANNPTNYGYRLDNIKISGTKKEGSSIGNASNRVAKISVVGNSLVFSNINDGAVVGIFNALGAKVKTATTEDGKVAIPGLAKGVYIVKAGGVTQKVLVK